MKHVQLQLNILLMEHLSPSVITPRCFNDLLLEIENQFPKYLKLPYDPNVDILKLYQTTYLHQSLG